jgi:hypothetical protein
LDDDIMDQYDNDEPNIAKDNVPKVVDTTTDPDLFFEPSIELLMRHLAKRAKGAKHSNAQA